MFKIKKSLQKDVREISREYGYKSEDAFIEDALERRILDLKKAGFLEKARRVKDKIKKKGFTEAEILRDFDKSCHAK